jgi:signal transduction histidine kinase
VNGLNFRFPVFFQVFFFLAFISIGSTTTGMYIFKNYTKELIEDDIFEKYLKNSELLAQNLNPTLKMYHEKILNCIESDNCNPKFIVKDSDIKFSEEEKKKFYSERFYFSDSDGIIYIYFQNETSIYWVNLDTLSDSLIDISFYKKDYMLLINKKGKVILNVNSPYPINSILKLDLETSKKLEKNIISSSFYIKDENTNSITMNLYHTLDYLNLIIVVGNDEKSVFYELDKIENYLLKVLLFIIPCILVISLFVSRSQKNRLTKILNLIHELKKENFSARINIQEKFLNDEIKDLMLSFNFTISELEKFHKMNIDKLVDMNSQLLESNYQLAEAKNLADKANQAKTIFLANMSHDIRTPLNAIIGFTQIIRESEFYKNIPDDLQTSIENIELSGKNLLELINNILDLSKIEAGKMELNIENINLVILVQSIYSINLSLAERKEIQFKYSLDRTIPEFLKLDRTKVNQILMNLLSNAIKFTPNKKSVYLKVYRLENKLVLEVIDEGIGIPSDKLDSIFDAYEQSDRKIVSNFGGTGLGLNIVKKIVELMQGTLVVESELGKGSTFRVSLNLLESDLVYKQTNPSKQIDFSNQYTVLVIDDNILNYEILKFKLKKLGLVSIHARDGEEGLELIKLHKPDLILLDIHMPKMNGIELKKILLENSSLKNIPTIFMSADVFSENKKEALDLYHTSFITKPIDFNELNQLLLKYLK